MAFTIVTPSKTNTTSNIRAEASQQAVSLQEDERLSKQASFTLKESSVDISLYMADEETPVWCILSKELEVRL